MALLVVRFYQNVMNYSIWLKTERKTIISDYSDFTKIAPTVPLCSVGTRLGTQVSYNHFTVFGQVDVI